MAAPRSSISRLIVLAAMGAATACPQPKERSRTSMSILTNKVENYVPDPSVAMVRAKVLGSRFKPDGKGSESGAITFKSIDLYRGAGPAPAALFEIEGTRMADANLRMMDARNQWNALPFAMNDELLLALHPSSNPKLFVALAAVPSMVQGADLKEAMATESTPVVQRIHRLRIAVQSESHLLQNYGFAALRVPGVATREQAAAVLTQAFEAASTAGVRLGLFAEMESPPYADMSKGPDAANRAILSAWLKAILHEQDAERHASLLNHFAAQLGSPLAPDAGRDRDLRARFVAAIQDPPKAQVAAMLRTAAAANPSDDRLKRLAEAWAH